jgi:uncharacterized protein involved in exopolysaccharide biosynthesis
MNEKNQNDEISLMDLFIILWQRKVMIIAITMAAMIGVVIFSIISLVLPSETSPLPNIYTPKALMLIDNKSSSGGGFSSMLNSSGLGGLASLAGVSLSSSPNYSQLAVFLIETNLLLDSVVNEFDLIKKYKIERFPRAISRKMLKKSLKASNDSQSGVLEISFTNTDPIFARDVVNYCVAYLEKRFDELGLDRNKIEKENLERSISNTFKEIQNLEMEARRLERSVSVVSVGNPPSVSLELTRIEIELEAQKQVYTQLRTQYEVLKVAMASETPVFQVLEYAEILDQKSGPRRSMLCIIVTFAAVFFAVFLAFLLNAIENIKNDPETMAKLRRKK